MSDAVTIPRQWFEDLLAVCTEDRFKLQVLKAVFDYAADGTEDDTLIGDEKELFIRMKRTIQHRKRQTRLYTKRKATPSESDAVKTSESDAGSETDASTSTPSESDAVKTSESDARFSKDLTNNQELYNNIKGGIRGESESVPESPKRKIFVPPTLEEVAAYCRERNNNVDPEQFISFYQSKNWMIGKNRMKDFRAAVRTWEKYQRSTNNRPKRDYSGI